jgi:cation-transporting ATPase E
VVESVEQSGVTTAGDTRPTPPLGLTSAEVAERIENGQVNRVEDTTSRSVEDIIKANVFTRFNAILGSLLLVILIVGPLNDALFGIVLVSNAVIGIVQEVRAKRTLDKLALLSAPQARVLRDGIEVEIPMSEVVLDDLAAISPGDQIGVDGAVVHSQALEVDESLLTGESDPIHKSMGDELLSGSFVVAGNGRYRATKVGGDSYANQLSSEARRFSLVSSELRSGIDQFLRVVTWVMIPTAILLVISQLAGTDAGVRDALRGSVAGIGAIIPEGLVLLTSIAFAVGGMRLARKRVLVQELAAIEGLARVDVICLDKTGTLTESALEVASIEPVPGEEAPLDALGALPQTEARPNASLAAIADAVAPTSGWIAEAVVPFSSARKWSGATFADQGTWMLGAPDVLLDTAAAGPAVTTRIAEHTEGGRRVLLVARSDLPLQDDALPPDLRPVSLVVLEERIRADAGATLAYFAEQGVTVKVISGDHPRTVGAVARAVDVDGADQPVDARSLPEDAAELEEIMDTRSVFGRVGPHQKRAMVHALQARGHTVAMTGDGVNDVLALKDADIGVAMGAGSSASRAVARLVLLDNDFSVMPDVVGEGRRVINNVERVANLFLTKSVYAFVLALAVGFSLQPFPFFPRHLTLVSSLTIGIPAFFLALAPSDHRAESGFVGRVLRFAVPAGIVAAAATFTGYSLARDDSAVSQVEAQTVATIVLFCVAMWVLAILARPFTPARALLVGLNGLAFVIVLTVPSLREWFALVLPEPLVFFAAIGVAAVAAGLLEAGWQVVHLVSQFLRQREQGENFPYIGGLPPRIGPPQPVTTEHSGGDADDA